MTRKSSACGAGCWRGTAAARRHFASVKGCNTCAQLGRKRRYKFTMLRKRCSCLISWGGGQSLILMAWPAVGADLLLKWCGQEFPKKALQKHIFQDRWREHWWPRHWKKLPDGGGVFAFWENLLGSRPCMKTHLPLYLSDDQRWIKTSDLSDNADTKLAPYPTMIIIGNKLDNEWALYWYLTTLTLI